MLFDLPVETSEEIREYTRFRKFLLRDGFVMMQQSVYTKIALNQTAVTAIVQRVKKNKPKKGLVQLLSITEKQFASMEYIVGSCSSDTIHSDERIIEV